MTDAEKIIIFDLLTATHDLDDIVDLWRCCGVSTVEVRAQIATSVEALQAASAALEQQELV